MPTPLAASAPILHPTDCGATSREVYAEVCDLARALEARVHLLHVVPTHSEWTVAFQIASMRAFELFSELERLDQDGLIAGASIRVGPVVPTVAAAAASLDAPLIALRAERRGGLCSLLFGSPIRRLQRQTQVPLYLVRARPTLVP